MSLNPLSAPFVPGPSKVNTPSTSPPPTTPSPSRSSLDYQSAELAQGDQIWGLSRLTTPPPPPTSRPSSDRLEDLSSPSEDPLADQTFHTAREGSEEEEKSFKEEEGEEDQSAVPSQQEVAEPSPAPSPPTPTTSEVFNSDEDNDSPFIYSSSSRPPTAIDLPAPSSTDPLSSPSDPLQSLAPPPTASPEPVAVSPEPFIRIMNPPPPTARPLSSLPDPNPVPSLVEAISNGELFKLERIFAASSLSPFALSNTPLSHHTQLTPLHLAASHGHLSIVQFLLSSEGGALAGMEDAEGETALHKASLKGHLPVVSFLIKTQGVNPHARDKEGFTALHNACSKGFLDIVRLLCINSSAASYDPEESLSSGEGRVKGVDRKSKGGWTPLMCAVADGHLPVVLFLVTKQNADPLVRNNFGETAYDVAAGVFEVYICEVLEQFEASRWPSGDAPRAEPYNVLAVHQSVPVSVYENQRLDARLKTLAISSGKPRFSPSGLGRLGRRSPWELKVPSGSRVHAGSDGEEEKWAGVVPCRGKEDIGLPEKRRAFVMPLPQEEAVADATEERSHFWLSEWAVDVSSPKVDATNGWSYAPSFSTPYELWTPYPPPPLAHLLSGASLISAALGSSPRSGSDHHLSSTPSTRAEQGSATWVRRRGWVRIMRRRLDLEALPFLEPDGFTLAGYEADGGKVGARRDKGHEEGEEMGSFPASWVSNASTVDARGKGGDEEEDYLARARYLTGGRKALKVLGADAASVTTVRGKKGSRSIEDDEVDRVEPLADLRRRLGKLERAVGALRFGLTSETNDFRKNAAGTLLVELSNELENLQARIASRGGANGDSPNLSLDSDSDTSEFVYPTSSPSASTSRSRRQGRGSNASQSTSASTDYFHVAGSQVPDITTVLSESDAFRVPTHEAGLKVRRASKTLLPMIARAEWERDELAADCRRCRRRFTFFLRKHHCRRCGLVVCDSCSSHRVLLPPAEIVLDPATPFSRLSDEINVEHRTCDPCFAEVSTPALGRSLASVSESLGGGSSREGGSIASDLAECPVCNRTLADFGGPTEQESHVRACLEDGGSSVQAGRYLVYSLKPESSLVGVECVICLEEFASGSRVARLNCLCTFHDSCLSAWLSRGRACPVHAREA